MTTQELGTLTTEEARIARNAAEARFVASLDRADDGVHGADAVTVFLTEMADIRTARIAGRLEGK